MAEAAPLLEPSFGVPTASTDAEHCHEVAEARLRALEGVDLWSCPFAVVDIETTGSVAGRDGVTEIAVVQVCEGRVRRAWRSFVNPLLPSPRFITRLTGITDAMVAQAPPLASLLPNIVEEIGDNIFAGHNVRFDAGFIDFELRRYGLGRLHNPKVDTLALARRTIAEVPDYRLGTLTRELGIDVERHHRALADAAATAELLVHCIRKLEDRGVFTYAALQEFLRTRALSRRRCARRAFGEVTQLPVWTSALADELRGVPQKPGVYLLKDAGHEVVYVGKSRNLRQRLRTYATAAKPAGAKVKALRGTVASFDYLVTGSEFEALLLEAELVREHNPPFNQRLRNFRESAFIKIEGGQFGRVMTTTLLTADGARYFGPYTSMPAVRAAVVALQDALGLHCADDPAEPTPAVPEAEYRAQVDEAVAFIEGAADEVLLSVAKRRDEAAARQRLEVAEEQEQRLERLRRLRRRHEALEYATGLDVLVLGPSPDPSEESCFLFCGGRLVAQSRLPRRLPQRDEARQRLAGMLAERYRPEQMPRSFARQADIDQLHILAEWYRDRREGLAYIDLPRRSPSFEEAQVWSAAMLDGSAVTSARAH